MVSRAQQCLEIQGCAVLLDSVLGKKRKKIRCASVTETQVMIATKLRNVCMTGDDENNFTEDCILFSNSLTVRHQRNVELFNSSKSRN